MPPTLRSAKKRESNAPLVDERGEPRQLYGYENDPAQVPHFRREYHRLHVDYQVLISCLSADVRNYWVIFTDKYEDTHEQLGLYLEIFNLHEKLKYEYVDPPTIPLRHDVSANGIFEAILREGDTWESVHFKIRKALDGRKEETRDFFELMISFLMGDYADENDELIGNIVHGPLRLFKYLCGQLRYE